LRLRFKQRPPSRAPHSVLLRAVSQNFIGKVENATEEPLANSLKRFHRRQNQPRATTREDKIEIAETNAGVGSLIAVVELSS
jgi:hypothetical protein